MKTFYQILANSFVGVITINLVWFALTLWVYVQTQSVLATSLMSGIYLVATAVTGIWFGSLVDRHKKRTMMIVSSVVSFISFSLAFLLYLVVPDTQFTDHFSLSLWALVLMTFVGVVVGNIRNIALPTVTTILVPEDRRDKANGLAGTITGISFLIASIASGFLLATSGLYWIFMAANLLLLVAVFHLLMINVPEKKIVKVAKAPGGRKFDFLDTIDVIQSIPGLLGLIIFNSMNNFLGGVFMPLLDPYGLSLVSPQVWGVLWGILSLGFIIGGLIISKRGLGKNPLKTMFSTNIVLWVVSIFFAIQPNIYLLSIGLFIYICLIPFIEASEQTILQKIVPKERQGRVFGFAQSVESSASPLTAFAIGPITQFFFVPFMTNGKGAELIGSWFGVGTGRGIGLVFVVTGIIGLALTLLMIRSKSYAQLSKNYPN